MTQTQIKEYEEQGKEILIDGSDSQLEKLAGVPVRLNQIFKSIMEKNVDYGTIPGTPKPSLWKPGAELLANYFGLVASDPVIESKIEDRSEKPYFEYVIKQRFYRDGVLIGAGEGACNTKETRYAFRWLTQNKLPKDTDVSQLESQERSYNNSKFQVYKWPTSPDEVFTLQNTVLKMAKKRAFIDGILSITGASRIFTQDLKEEPEENDPIKAAKDVTPKPNGEKKPVEKGIPIKSGLEGSFS